MKLVYIITILLDVLTTDDFFISAPPTYEETVGALNINDLVEDPHPIGSKPYSPRYPVYHNTNI